MLERWVQVFFAFVSIQQRMMLWGFRILLRHSKLAFTLTRNTQHAKMNFDHLYHGHMNSKIENLRSHICILCNPYLFVDVSTLN